MESASPFATSFYGTHNGGKNDQKHLCFIAPLHSGGDAIHRGAFLSETLPEADTSRTLCTICFFLFSGRSGVSVAFLRCSTFTALQLIPTKNSHLLICNFQITTAAAAAGTAAAAKTSPLSHSPENCDNTRNGWRTNVDCFCFPEK